MDMSNNLVTMIEESLCWSKRCAVTASSLGLLNVLGASAALLVGVSCCSWHRKNGRVMIAPFLSFTMIMKVLIMLYFNSASCAEIWYVFAVW